MTRTGNAAIAWARANADRPPAGLGNGGTWLRMCLQYVRSAYGLPGGTPDAGKAWDWAKLKHRETDGDKIPRGVPVFWETSSVADHVALSLGGGLCVSTDARRRGACDVVRIDDLTRQWGMTLLGWTEDLNGVRVWSPPPRKRTERQRRGGNVHDAEAKLEDALKAKANRKGTPRGDAVRKALAAVRAIPDLEPRRR